MTRSMTFALLVLTACCTIQQPPLAQAAAKPRVLNLSESQDPRTLDPQLAGDVLSTKHCMLVYEGLLEFEPFQHTRLRPCIAAEMPVYDAEKLTYTFKLRNDVYFADDACFKNGKGRKVVASDFVYSFKRLAALPQLAGYWIVEGFIEGLDEFRNKGRKLSGEALRKHMATDVSGLSAPDDQTLVIKMTQTFPQFLYAATMSYLCVLANEACEQYGEALGKHPVGTGPFVLKEWRSKEYLEYARNPGYRDVRLSGVPADSPLKPFEGTRLPLSDSIRFEVIEDDKKCFQRFLAGDFARIGLGIDQRKAVLDTEALAQGKLGDDALKEEFRKKGLHLAMVDEPVLDYISFNMADAVVGASAGKKGRAIRRAISQCIDRQRMILEQRGGVGVPANRLVPPGVFGHTGKEMQSQKLDTEAAREMLRQAGLRVEKRLTKWRTLGEDGKQVTVSLLLRSKDERAQAYAKFIGECAEQVGIKVECEFLTFGEFLERQDQGKGQAYDAGWVMDYPDAQNMLQLLYGPNKTPGVNSASFENTEYDKCFAELATLDDQKPAQAARKLELIKRMTEIVDEETPWVLLDWRSVVVLFHEGLLAPPPCDFNYGLLRYTVMAQP